MVAQKSYSPYSGFKVGAALRLTTGEIVAGTNVENVSYGLTMCAERSALVRAVSEFGPGIRVAAVAVTNLNGAPSPPCGACRQMLAEFVLPDAPVAFPAADGIRVMSFSDVLPLAFDMKLK
jgi:homotetrameric cytidine deaminase